MKELLSFAMCLFCTFTAFAKPCNIAPLARITVSAEAHGADGAKVCDGITGIDKQGEWNSGSKLTSWGAPDYPWILLEWDKPHSIERIVLYDRPTTDSHTAGGTLHFSDGSKLLVTQIPNQGWAKALDFPVKTVSWVRFEVTDGHGKNLGLSEIEVFPSVSETSDYVSKVNPYIESARGRYIFFITGNQPYGMISAAPMTRNKNQYGGGYNYNSMEILGFPQVHCWMMAGVTLMPITGEINPTKGEQAWKSTFSHDDEIVQPGYHRVFLRDYGIWTEQTATERVSLYRLKYVEDAVAKVLLNLGGYTGTATMNDCRVRKSGNSEIIGSVNTTGRFWGGPDNVRIYFILRFNKDFERMDGWRDTAQFTDIASLQGINAKTARNEGQSYYDAPATGVALRYQMKAGDELLCKVAVSYTSEENARRNMDEDRCLWDFDAVRRESQAEWNEWLGRIDVKGGTIAQQVKFYTDLWHGLLGRHKLDDVSGDYPDYMQGERDGTVTRNAKLTIRSLPKNADGKVKFHMYNSDAFWLTQWNLNILWGLAYPDVLDDFAACLVQYAENGGQLPRGPVAGGYSYIMTGCPATPLITSAYQRNMLTRTTAEQAFRAMVRSHKPGGMLGDKRELQFYIDHGWYPNNAGITLEASFQDRALSEMAARMGKKKEAAYYLKRSSGWTKLFRTEFGLIFPKDEKGEWLHDDPLSGKGWVEANAWQGTFSLSFDIPTLAKLMGGNDALCSKLNYAFEQATKDDFVFGYSSGHVSYANQPGCSNAHVFNHAGAPHLSQYWVRRVNEQAYGAVTPDAGYGGHDEDQGQMGGVSALMSMGLFSLQGACSRQPEYELTAPVFDEINIKLHRQYNSGERFTIKVRNNSPENHYIRQALLDGKVLDKLRLTHERFSKGGTLEMTVDNMPSKE